uniref:beta-N-acetylhexosaminidase n=1 Tax=Enterobius vermicularis TaxID=51028 RepID=A0A0N4VIB8_ENTVE
LKNVAFQIDFYDNVLIHFDLKGAPPKVHYLIEIFKIARSNGATGILLEWEDTFPWSGILEQNRASEAYTIEEVDKILGAATRLGLTVVPLVQTFGHLEWILKVEKFRRYRENDIYPQVVCLADNEGVDLVKEAIKQVINVHKKYGITYFHIGGDEAFEYGVCEKDVQWFRDNPGSTKEILAAQHLKKIAEYVQSLIPGVRVLAWHDMIKDYPQTLIKETGLSDIIEPVVWDYSETLQQQSDMTWKMLSLSFSTVWGSSAYKGANTPSTQEISLIHYMRNNQAWLSHKKLYGKYFKNFRGLILTGWSRYDHFAVLTELLVSAIPSLVLNLQVARVGPTGYEALIVNETAKALRCSNTITITEPATLTTCVFPGVEVFKIIHGDLPELKTRLKFDLDSNHQLKGWLGRMNIRHNYTQQWYLSALSVMLLPLQRNLLTIEEKMRVAMSRMYSDNTIDEWLYEYFDPTAEKIQRYLDALERLSKIKTYPVRSFEIRRDLRQTAISGGHNATVLRAFHVLKVVAVVVYLLLKICEIEAV